MEFKELIEKVVIALAPVALIGVLVLWRDVSLLTQKMEGTGTYMTQREIALEFALRDQQHTQMLIDLEQTRIQNERQDREIDSLR